LRTTAVASGIRAQIIAGQIFTSSGGGAIGYADQGGGVTEVRFTLPGDANLDGAVDVADLGALATNYGLAVPDWSQGDFDYSGVVDVADLGLLATYYGDSLATGPAEMSFGDVATPLAAVASVGGATGGATQVAQTVPEPAALGLIGIGAVGLVARRRCRDHSAARRR
jgi:hypothetical protein